MSGLTAWPEDGDDGTRRGIAWVDASNDHGWLSVPEAVHRAKTVAPLSATRRELTAAIRRGWRHG